MIHGFTHSSPPSVGLAKAGVKRLAWQNVRLWRVLLCGVSLAYATISPALLGSALIGSSAIGVVHAAVLATDTAPTGGSVVAGSASIAKSASQTLITQSSRRAIVNWQDFQVGSAQSVTFVQPSSSAITLNRVLSGNAAIIEGKLSANGNVWVVSPGGVLFGKSAVVNVQGLMATTSDITNNNFMDKNYSFSGATAASITNQGVITTESNGNVVFSAAVVTNEGMIQANLGKVTLAGANDFTVDFNGDGLLKYTVDRQVASALVQNSGTILVNGGKVLLTTGAARKLADGVIKMTGVIEASSATLVGGEVILSGDQIVIGGTIDASGATSGGTIQIGNSSAAKITLLKGAILNTSATIISKIPKTVLKDAGLTSTEVVRSKSAFNNTESDNRATNASTSTTPASTTTTGSTATSASAAVSDTSPSTGTATATQGGLGQTQTAVVVNVPLASAPSSTPLQSNGAPLAVPAVNFAVLLADPLAEPVSPVSPAQGPPTPFEGADTSVTLGIKLVVGTDSTPTPETSVGGPLITKANTPKPAPKSLEVSLLGGLIKSSPLLLGATMPFLISPYLEVADERLMA